jgi:heme/copper-type cytochrome/quinol oxidase subunit 2
MHMKLSFRRSVCLAALLAFCAVPGRDQAQEQPAGRRIEIVVERFSFTPSRIRVQAGATIEFVLTSEDTYHGFFLPQFGVNLLIPPIGKGEATARVTFTQPGEYAFECSRPCGAGHTAMRGVIVVEA